MTYHENPADIPVGTEVAFTYTGTGNTYYGTVTGPGVMRDTSGQVRYLGSIGDRVTVLGDAKDDLDRLADATAEVERLQARIEQRDRDISSALAREKDITETLDDLKREVGAEWVRLAEAHGWDMDTVERAIDHLGLEMPKPKPVTFSVTLDIEFTATPANREVAKKIDADPTTDQITAVIEEAITGLDHVDLNENVLELDVWRGMNVEVRDADITD